MNTPQKSIFQSRHWQRARFVPKPAAACKEVICIQMHEGFEKTCCITASPRDYLRLRHT
jgi:hypothetical protein